MAVECFEFKCVTTCFSEWMYVAQVLIGLSGFWNAIIFFRPHYLTNRERQKGRWTSIQCAIDFSVTASNQNSTGRTERSERSNAAAKDLSRRWEFDDSRTKKATSVYFQVPDDDVTSGVEQGLENDLEVPSAPTKEKGHVRGFGDAFPQEGCSSIQDKAKCAEEESKREIERQKIPSSACTNDCNLDTARELADNRATSMKLAEASASSQEPSFDGSQDSDSRDRELADNRATSMQLVEASASSRERSSDGSQDNDSRECFTRREKR